MPAKPEVQAVLDVIGANQVARLRNRPRHLASSWGRVRVTGHD